MQETTQITMESNSYLKRFRIKIRSFKMQFFLLLFVAFSCGCICVRYAYSSDKIINNGDKSARLLPFYDYISLNISNTSVGFSIENLKAKIARINLKPKILNRERYMVLENDLVIVVQVHTRLLYLKYLISSLRKAAGISKVLLIFSHNVFSENVNALIQSLDFCKVMQIFYPFSTQLYPDTFPGNDPHDCPSDLAQNLAIQKACSNAFYPDSRGRYRKSTDAQIKHHWWWTINWVFQLEALRTYKGPVLFLEENLYFTEDFIPALLAMERTVKKSCSNCKIMSLAVNYGQAFNLNLVDFDKSTQAKITRKIGNMGLAFTRDTWMDVVNCRHVFCTYDDHTWYASLQNVFTSCLKDAKAVTLSLPRVFDLSSCNLDSPNDGCDPSESVSKIDKLFVEHKTQLYPKTIDLYNGTDLDVVNDPFGGWGDPRDHAMCLKMTTKW